MVWLLALLLPLHLANAQHSYSPAFLHDPLDEILEASQFNLKWLDQINEAREHAHRPLLDFTIGGVFPDIVPPAHQTPDSPERYNGKTLLAEFQTLKQRAPFTFQSGIKGIFLRTGDALPMSDQEFASWTRTLDYLSTRVNRWRNVNAKLEHYKKAAVHDLRGLIYLSAYPGGAEAVLKRFSSLDPSRKLRLRIAMIQLCQNSGKSYLFCQSEFYQFSTSLPQGYWQNDLTSLYRKYLPSAQMVWKSHFNITQVSKNIHWSPRNHQLTAVFSASADPELRHWVKQSLETAWKLGPFHVKIQFNNRVDPQLLQLHFISGIVPHTDGAGGNQIFLDANLSYRQKNSTQILQHEFGHLLGFPDCYVQFYDESNQTVVYYSLQKNNLMCNRNGVVTPAQVQKIQRAYQKSPTIVRNLLLE